MLPSQNIALQSEQLNCQKQQQNPMITKLNFLQSLIYLILTIFVDLSILIENYNYLPFILPQMILCFIISSLLVIFNKKINVIQMNICMTCIKLYSLFNILLIGQDIKLLISLVLEQYLIYNENFSNFLQRIIVKIGCLVNLIIQQQTFDILLLVSILILDIVKIIYFINQTRESKLKSQSDEHLQINENQIINNFEQHPLCMLLISKKDLIIKFKNQNFYNIFSNLCYSNHLDELILNELQYSIIGDNLENSVQALHENSLCQFIFDQKQSLKDDDKKLKVDKFSLIEILQKYLYFQCRQQLIIELFCVFITDSSNDQIFAGQLLINNEKDDIVLSLIDISKQHRFQEDQIRDQFKSSLIHSFSHELRTPLNSSCNFLQCLLNNETIKDEIKINFIQPAINGLYLQSYLINDIIDFSSLSSGNIQINLKNFKIKELIDEIRKLFKSVIEMKNLILYVDLSENTLESITSDFSRLIQILVNLVSNSIKYTNQGKIIIKLSTLVSNHLKISVIDEGYGIEQQRLEEISQMIKEMEYKKKFQNHKTWNGFGLLISSLLIQKLRPNNYKQSIMIFSEGFQKGTKVSFCVHNHSIDKSPSLNKKEKSLLLHRKPKESMRSDSNKNFSINGTLIQIGEIFISNRKVPINSQIVFQKISKSLKSNEDYFDQNSSESIKIMDYDYTIAEFRHLQAFMFTQNDQNYNKFQDQGQSVSSKQLHEILNYEQIKQLEDQESEQQLLITFQKIKKCTCNRILSVDDEIFNQKSLQCLLGQYGFEVVLAFNGQEAIEIIENTQKCSESCCLYLLILMDYQMPVMNGLQATKKLRQMMQSNIIKSINIVGLTAFNSKEDIEKCYKSGMNSVLSKPLVIHEFFELLKQL